MNAPTLSRFATRVRELIPYFLVALLPGGSILALVLWLQQRGQTRET